MEAPRWVAIDSSTDRREWAATLSRAHEILQICDPRERRHRPAEPLQIAAGRQRQHRECSQRSHATPSCEIQPPRSETYESRMKAGNCVRVSSVLAGAGAGDVSCAAAFMRARRYVVSSTETVIFFIDSHYHSALTRSIPP